MTYFLALVQASFLSTWYKLESFGERVSHFHKVGLLAVL